jgi:quinolinate synthase
MQVRAGAPGSVWAVGTEVHLVHRLADEVAPHGITVLSLDALGCLCSTMFRVSPNHLLWVLEGLVEGQVVNQVEVPEHQIHWGRVALDRMLAIH